MKNEIWNEEIDENLPLIVKYGIERFREKVNGHEDGNGLTGIPEIDAYYDIEEYPHIFVLGCLMDRRVKNKAEGAWAIPYKVCNHFGCFDMEGLVKISQEDITNFFIEEKPCIDNKQMSEVFYRGIHKIHDDYDDDASRIWSGEPSSSVVVNRFADFHGAGAKISTMATNILIRRYGVTYSDYSGLDISPDVHVCRIFYRYGLVKSKDDKDGVVLKARELYPRFPGIMDYALWKLGHDEICVADFSKCKCAECPLAKECGKIC